MVDTKQKITEIETLLAELKDKVADNDLKTKVDNLDLSEIKDLANLIFQEKADLLAKNAQLEKDKADEKTKLEKEAKDAKEALATLKEKVSDKLTPELMAKLEALSNKNLELKRIPKQVAKKDADGKEVKDSNGNIVYEDLKDAEGNIVYEEILDLTKIETALADLKTQKPTTAEQPTNY